MKANKVKTSMKDLSELLKAILYQNMDITLRVTGNSMYPMLSDKRDSVILTRCKNLKLKFGDIPLYKRNNGQYVLHRIVSVNENSYDLCGDNQYTIEKNLPKENIIAVVKAFERNGKTYNCNNFIYKCYWHLRIFSIPFRRLFYRCLRKLCKTKSNTFTKYKKFME